MFSFLMLSKVWIFSVFDLQRLQFSALLPLVVSEVLILIFSVWVSGSFNCGVFSLERFYHESLIVLIPHEPL